MKPVSALLLLVSFIDCNKEKIPDSIIGRWQLEEIMEDTGAEF